MNIKLTTLLIGGLLLLFVACKKENDLNTQEPDTPTVSANFDADKTTALKGTSIQFTDQSKGEPTTWKWSFPGGTPSASTEQNPVVTYQQAGEYEVTLEVSNEGSTDTKKVTGYVEIFDEVPAIASDQEFTVSEGISSAEVAVTLDHNFSGNQGVKFEIVPSALAESWVINESTGEISLAQGAILDYESPLKEYVFDVKVSLVDYPEHFSETEIKIKISNVDERPTKDMITYFPLDGDGKDESNFDFTAQIFGNYVLPTENRMYDANKAMSFDPNFGSAFMNLLGKDPYKNLQEFTVGFWVNFTDVDNHGYPMAIYNWADTEQYRMELEVHSDEVKVGFSFDANTHAEATANVEIKNNMWYHFVVRWDGANWSIFVDGRELQAVNTHGSNLMFPSTDSPGLMIASWDWSSYSFFGKMDEIRIFRADLSDADINIWYQEEMSME